MTKTPDTFPDRHDVLTAIGYGVAIWVIATTLITTLGPVLLPDSGSWPGVLAIIAFTAAALALAVIAYVLYRRRRADSITHRLLFGSGIAATGLLLDAVIYGAAASRYPSLTEPQQGPVAFFLVSAYAALIIAPHVVRTRQGEHCPIA